MIKGTGISFRSRHWRSIMATKPDVPWMEVLADNFLEAGGMPAYQLDTLAARYPLTLHSVGLSIGSYEPLDFNYLAQLKALKKRSGAIWLSDHLCFTHAQGAYCHDLLPLPYTQECLKHVTARLDIVQDYFGEAILIENPSSYIDCNSNELSEAEFLNLLVRGAGCKLLLDVNNIYVSQYNRNQKIEDYLHHMPWNSVAEIHLAGFDQQDGILIDAHNNPVSAPVWQLFKRVLQVLPNIPALIEWDNELPPLEDLIAEQEKAEYIREELVGFDQTAVFRSADEPLPPTQAKASNMASGGLKRWQQQLVSAVHGQPSISKDITCQFAALPNISNEDALVIYQNNYRGTLITALEQCYKVCRQLIGTRSFHQQAAKYVALTPSIERNLNHYGSHFGEQLTTLIDKEPAYSTLPYLPDMAVYEYRYQSVYYAPTASDNDLPSSASVNADLLAVSLSAHCRLFTSPYPISEIWRLHDEASLARLPLLSREEREYCLIYRNSDLQIVTAVLDHSHYQLCQQLAGTTAPLPDFVALAQTLGLEPDTLLPRWISAGWLSIKKTFATNTLAIATLTTKKAAPEICAQT